ncbi:transcription elongation protein SprT [Streptosporangium canum]
MTREEWLQRAVEIYRPWFLDLGKPLPEVVRVSIGFTSGGMRSKARAECWNSVSSTDGTNEIFISPTQDDPVQIVATLLHELIHAADDCKSGHKGEFMKMAKALGFLAKFTDSANRTEELNETLSQILKTLGPMPHSPLVALVAEGAGKKKQTTRMLKLVAYDCPCEYSVRTTRQKLEDIGFPLCPHGVAMKEETP